MEGSGQLELLDEQRPADGASWSERGGPHSAPAASSSSGPALLQSVSAAAASRLQTREPDVMGSALLGGSFEYFPVPGRPFASTLRILRVADLVVQQAEDAPHITRGAFSPGLAGIVVPIRYDGALAVANGMSAQPFDAMLAPDSREFSVTCRDPTDWAAMALPMDLLEELADLTSSLGRRTDSVNIVRFPAVAGQRLSAALFAAARLADDLPEVLAEPGCAEGLAASLRELLSSALTADATRFPTRRATREAMRVLRGAEDYLHAHVHRPIYRDELCQALAVSRRKLHDAFLATVGLSPQAYLKVRRLVLARRALRQGGDGAATLVKSVALSHGFWHLGYFAKDYRALFGERPSHTAAAEQRGSH